jgi:hypothetical protein
MTIARTDTRSALLVTFYTFLSWLGMMLHNAQELPKMTLLDPQELLPTLMYLALLLAYLFLPWRRVTAALLLVWAGLHLVGGGIITVIPFAFLPFYPEQSLQHYLAHIVYAAAQLPLIVFMWRELRAPQTSRA